jgi:sulfate/thiosulfate transport system ATP-binding protein
LEFGGSSDGLHGRVVAVHRLADRITVELQVHGQERTLEVDLVAAPGVIAPAVGSEPVVTPLAWKVFPADIR